MFLYWYNFTRDKQTNEHTKSEEETMEIFAVVTENAQSKNSQVIANVAEVGVWAPRALINSRNTQMHPCTEYDLLPSPCSTQMKSRLHALNTNTRQLQHPAWRRKSTST